VGRNRRYSWALDDETEAEVWQLPPELMRELRGVFPGCRGITRVQLFGTGALPTIDESAALSSVALDPKSVAHELRSGADGWVETWLVIEYDTRRAQVFHAVRHQNRGFPLGVVISRDLR
jgi:hypothetical protein